jgi:aerobic carbon-monoxide dehydrogenase medium subunit
MKPASFDYFKPTTLEEAAALLSKYEEDAKILAGGQTLVPMMNFRLVSPQILVDINDVEGLNFIEQRADAVRLGALVRWCEIETSPIIAKMHPLLFEAVKSIAHYQIRNRGTWAGSCAHADPAAEFPAVALVSNAKFSLFSTGGRRLVSAGDFFLGPLTTALRADEILVDVEIPRHGRNCFWAFEEFTLRTGDFAIAGTAVMIDHDIRDDPVRFVAFGVGDKAYRLPAAELIIAKSGLTGKTIREAAASIGNDLEVRADIHASAEYRLALTKVLLERSMNRVLASGYHP